MLAYPPFKLHVKVLYDKKNKILYNKHICLLCSLTALIKREMILLCMAFPPGEQKGTNKNSKVNISWNNLCKHDYKVNGMSVS